ncbi:MAG: Xaa-Pro peptidase family protein [Planctomycetota bacterium]|nr:Xaa-Pro peptidase family protein [Planctomycetota bacterium]
MLTPEGCRARQRRLLERLSSLNLDGALITEREHVYYFTGYRGNWKHAPAACLDKSGRMTLVSWAESPEGLAVDEALRYPAHKFATMPTEQAREAAAKLKPALPAGKKLGVDLEGPAALARLAGADAADLTPEIVRLRKRKEPDEVDALRRAIDVSQTMYAYAKAAVKPGLDELELFGELRAVATRAAGGDLERFGNDFRANSPGGPARKRAMLEGELYILDAGPSVDGYHADNCRTFAVDGEGSGAQHKACRHIAACLEHLEQLAKPGIAGRALFEAADRFLKDGGYAGMVHHLGHGIGLAPHEAPQLNPEYESVLEAGDVITMEPGIYSEELRAGIRLEHNYAVTEQGLERLTTFPLELL